MAQNLPPKRSDGDAPPQPEAIIGAVADAIVVYDRSGAIRWVNDAARDLLRRITPPDLQSHAPATIPALLRPRDVRGRELPLNQRVLMRALRGEQLTGASAVDISLTGGREDPVYINVSAAPIRDDDGQITGAVCIYRDVTARRRLDERAHSALAALVDLAQAIVQPDIEASLSHPRSAGAESVAATRAILRRLGNLTLEVLGCDRFAMVAASSPDERVRPLASLSRAGTGRREWWAAAQAGVTLREAMGSLLAERLYAGEYLALDYREPPFNQRPNPFRLATFLVAPMRIGNRVVGALATDYNGAEHTFTDEEIGLTRAVAQLAALVVEREGLHRERQEARSREESLREMNQRMDEFVSVASHELRTPLTTLKLFVDLLNKRSHLLTPQRQSITPFLDPHMFDLMERQVARLERLVGDLLDSSAIQAGRLALRLRPVDLATIVREVCDERQLTSQSHRMQCLIPRQSYPVIADSERISQVLTNFVTNALKYTPEGTEIVVRIQRRGDLARVSVADRGPGIPKAALPHLFDRFYRAPDVGTRSGSRMGVGLGLFISKTIVERHGGRIGVSSALGKGATFWFTLPLTLAKGERPVTGDNTDTEPVGHG